ncbi:MAG: HEAT repeat domain-containing protein, partial [Planctomycetota bacterium]
SVAVAYIGILAAARHYPARKPLGALVEHESARVAEAALGALSELNSAPDTDVVRRMLDAKEPSRRLMAARILRRMDDLSGLEPTLRIAREGEDVLTRREAVKLLGEFRRAGAVDTLIEALYDEDGLTRSHAARSLQYTLHAIFPFRRFELRTAGYDSGAPRAERLAAIRRIRDWWDKHRAAVGSTPAR